MAKKFGINILLDVHGLEGSQNGTIHSGKAGSVAWKRFMPQHLATLQELARRYKDEPALWGLEIINEPSVFGNYFALLRYYRAAYALLRQELRPGTYTIFQDGFVPWLFSGTLWPRKNYPVIMDTHLYLLPSNVLNGLSPKVYDRFRSAIYKTTLYLTRIRQPLIVGEWSAILPQAQFNRTPQEQHLKLVGETIQRQREMYTPALAHFYWNYKADGRGMYNYRSLVEDSII
jgi:glucan 1,3-beta-glucosidase